MGRFEDGFDEEVKAWKEQSEKRSEPAPSFILIGDNIDKNVAPRHMRHDHQVQSIHSWHWCASEDRFDTSTVSMQLRDPDTISAKDYVPSVQDVSTLRDHYIILCARVLVSRLPFLQHFQDAVPKHIQHELSHEMAKKSNVVCIYIYDSIVCVHVLSC